MSYAHFIEHKTVEPGSRTLSRLERGEQIYLVIRDHRKAPEMVFLCRKKNIYLNFISCYF